MLLRRYLFSAVLSIAVLGIVSMTHAQHPGFFGKSDDGSDFTGLYDPFCDLDTCWFEPIYCDDTERPSELGVVLRVSADACQRFATSQRGKR